MIVRLAARRILATAVAAFAPIAPLMVANTPCTPRLWKEAFPVLYSPLDYGRHIKPNVFRQVLYEEMDLVAQTRKEKMLPSAWPHALPIFRQQ